MNTNTRSFLAAIIVLAGFGCASAHAGEDAICKLVFDAMAKAVLTPNHSYVTLKVDAMNGGKPQSSEIIDTGKARYIKADGKWRASMSTQALLDQMTGNRKNAKSTCQLVHDEPIDGSNASLYAVREDNPDAGLANSKVWLAKANGLPVHINMDMEGMHSETRYVYGAVSAPPLN